MAAMLNYMGGQKSDFILQRFNKGLQKLYEVRALLAKEIKQDNG